MMRARKCDRCGKFYDHYDGSRQFKNGERANALSLIDHDLDGKYWSRMTYDLCPACMGEFETFIRGGAVFAAEKEGLE
nr:MAG TPA: Rubredoxin evolution, hydrogenase, nickel, energy.86A [Caudoviricetes sp.]